MDVRAVALTLGTLLLTGCVAAEPAATTKSSGPVERDSFSSDGEDPAANKTSRTFSQTFPLEITQAAAGGHSGFNNNNCVIWSGHGQDVEGYAQVTWTSQSPLADTLELLIDSEATGSKRIEGRSPLKLEFQNYTTDGEPPFGDLTVAVQAVTPGLALMQAAQLKVAFRYNATAVLEADPNWGCSIG